MTRRERPHPKPLSTPRKKPWVTPKLTHYGSLDQITKAHPPSRFAANEDICSPAIAAC